MSGLKIGVCGCGKFAACFIPRFKAHPLVGEVALADVGQVRHRPRALES
jgi:predicted dehydrogenase